MENKINVSNKNIQQKGQNQVSQQTKSQVNYWMISTIILFLFLIGISTLYASGIKKMDKAKNVTVPGPTSSDIVEKGSTKYFKRLYDPSKKIFDEVDYPKEMQVRDENLVEFNCNEENLTSYDMRRSGLSLTLAEVRNFALCKTKSNGGVFIVTKIGAMNSGDKNIVYTIDKYDIYKPLTEIKLGGLVCSNILQITKDKVVYLNCGWGDGGGSTQQILRLNLDDGLYKEILNCTKIIGESAKCKVL